MGFLNGDNTDKPKAPSIYLDVTDQAKTIRPLKDKPQSLWGHTIPEVVTVGPDGKTPVSLRRYSFELCTSTSRSGVGCQGCTTQDPHWHLLDKKSQTNKKGQRVDFPKKCIHLLPVVELATGSVKVLKGGNQTYEAMDAWHTAQPDGQKDLRRCDWNIYKTGQKKMTKYHVIRNDASVFTPTQEQLSEAQAVITKAIQDIAPAAPERFMAIINGDVGGQTNYNLPETTQAVSTVATPVTVSNPPVPYVPVVAAPVVAAPVVAAPVVAAPVVAAPATTPPATSTSSTEVVAEFTAWLNQQPEFQGVGVLDNLVPVLKARIGGVNYYGCTPEQIASLRVELSQRLESLRTKRS